MSQTFERAPPRFSRRQVTKRKFNVVDSPNVLQNVQTDKNVSPPPRDKTQTLRASTQKTKNITQNDKIETQNKSGTKNTSGSLEKKRTQNKNSSTRDNKYSTQNKKLGTQSKKSSTCDSKSGTQEGKPNYTRNKGNRENEMTTDPSIDDADSCKNAGEVDSTPLRQQKFAEDAPAPGDVSVSFLASTPKPGRPQLSRRRPMSPVRETLVMPMSSQDSASSQEQDGQDFVENHVMRHKNVITLQDNKIGNIHRKYVSSESPSKRSPLKSSPRKGSPRKGSPQKQTPGGSISEKIASINRTRLEKKRKSSEIHSKFSENETNDDKMMNVTTGKSSIANKSVSGQTNKSLRTKSGTKKQKVSVPIKDIQVTTGVLDQQDSPSDDNNEDTDVLQTNNTLSDKSVKVTSITKSRKNKSVNKSKNVPRATVVANNVSQTRQLGQNDITTRQRRNVTSDDSDVTVRESNHRVSLSGHRRKSAVNRRLQALTKSNDGADTSATNMSTAADQTMMVWETEGQKRSRSDLIDLDVVLNTVTETLAARMDVYDTDEEQSAVHVLEKYLTQDITHMIHGVQTVMELQCKIKKCGQSVKQKQKSLMALQKDRIKMEEKCQPLKKAEEENENLTAINQFLKDLGKIIDKC